MEEAGGREEKRASAGTGCGQSPEPPPTRPRLGVEEQLLQAGNQGYKGMRRGPRGAPWRTPESVGAARVAC